VVERSIAELFFIILGWPARNLIVALAATSPDLLEKCDILCLRVFMKEWMRIFFHCPF
jgi:hypothetical protein